MADLSDIQATGSTIIVGSDSSGVETTAVEATLAGALHTNLRNESGIEIGTELNPVQIRHDKSLISPFGDLRVASQTNAFESIFNFDKLPLIYDESLVTGGTSTWNSITNSVDTVSTTTSGSSVIRQTRSRIRYNAARSVRVQISGNLGGNKANCTRRVGQFDTSNGIYFELAGTVLNVVIRSSMTGSVVNTAVDQSSWNLDKLDGTGSSGFTLDTSKHQLWIIEYGWQGIATVRFGLYLNGRIIYCHEINNSNYLTTPYMKSANLPIRTEITNTGATASNTTMSINCVVIKNEAEEAAQEGLTRAYSRTTLKTITTTDTPVLSLRLNSTHLDGIIQILKAAIYVSTADNVIWSVYLNPTLTASTFAVSLGYCGIDIAATAQTGGTILDTGFIGQNQTSEVSSALLFEKIKTLMGTNLAGTSDIMTITARSLATTADVLAAVTWREI